MRFRWFSWLPALIVMGVIFYFTSKPAVYSDESSRSIANYVLSLYEDMTETRIEDSNRISLLDSLNHVIRKGAHFIEYGMLACAIAFHLYVWEKRGRALILVAITFSALYAVTDEVHQLFVPGRSGEIKDVILDTCGAITGALFFGFICFMLNKRTRQDRAKESI